MTSIYENKWENKQFSFLYLYKNLTVCHNSLEYYTSVMADLWFKILIVMYKQNPKVMSTFTDTSKQNNLMYVSLSSLEKLNKE